MSNKEKIFVGIALFYIAYMVLPMVASFIPIPIWLVCIAVSVAVVVLYPNSFKQSFMYWFLVYFSVLLLYCIAGHPFHINGMGDSNAAFRRLTIEMAWILPNLLICSAIIRLKNKKIYERLGQGIIVLLVLSILMILPTLAIYSRALRLNTGGESTEEMLVELLPNYTLMSCYSYFIPVLCYGYKKAKGMMRVTFVAFIVLFVYAIIKTEITTSFLTAIIVILFTIIYQDEKKGNKKTLFVFLVIIGLIFVFYKSGLVLRFVDFLIDMYEGTVAQSKFVDFRNMLLSDSNDDTNVSVREYCRQLSMQCFYENPLIGSPGVGGHSSLLDRLGSMGLLGFFPYLFMLITNVRTWYKMMPERGVKYFYLSGIAIVFIFLYMKGLFSGVGMLFMTVLLPVPIIGIYELSKKITIDQ